MATYTYLAADLVSNNILAELPLRGVSFQQKLNSAGSFAATLDLADPRLITPIDPIGSTQPSRTALYIDRDGTLVWGGIIWTRRYVETSRALQLGGQEFWSYFDRRRIRQGFYPINMDKLTVARTIINMMQAVPGGNIGVIVGSETSGVPITRVYNPWDLKQASGAVQELSATTQGFDFAIDVAYDSNGLPAKYLHLGYPRRGRVAGSTGLVFDYSTNLLDYEWPEDGTKQTTTLYGTGAGAGQSMLISSASAPGLIDVGYPVLEDALSFKDESNLNLLGSYTQAFESVWQNPVTIPVFTTRAGFDPSLGSYITGDDVRFVLLDERFPNGLDVYKRIMQIDVTPGDGGSVEVVKLSVGDSVFP